MAKPKNETRTDKHLAWLTAEQDRIAATATLKATEEAAEKAASEFGEELKAAGKNGAIGPNDVTYVVQSCRKAKGSDEPPPYPYTLRRAQTINL